jgi:16S rRNA processing protein RimM
MIRVGHIVGVFGIQGAVKVKSLTDFGDRLAPGSELILGGVARKVEWSRPQGSTVVVKLAGLDTRNEAEGGRGQYLEVPESAVHRLPGDAWYHDQLIGLRVVTESGRELGVIEEIVELPANDVWVARTPEAETLVPATKEAVLRVDLENRLVTVGDWLMEVEEGGEEA